MRGFTSIINMELRKILAYRLDFWVTFIGQTLLQLFIARALWHNIFENNNTDEMQGFTLAMMTLYYLLVPISIRIIGGQNIGFISNEIYEGTFSRYLIYPVNAFIYKSITYLTHSLFYIAQFYFVFFLYSFIFDVPLIFENLATSLMVFLLASICYMTISMIAELISLWADNVWALGVMLKFCVTFFGGGIIPVDFFPIWARELLVVTPFPYLISLPVKASMNLVTLEDVINGSIILIFWNVVFSGIIYLMWRRGQRVYTGVGI